MKKKDVPGVYSDLLCWLDSGNYQGLTAIWLYGIVFTVCHCFSVFGCCFQREHHKTLN